MKPENPESIETSRKTIQFSDPNGDKGQEERVEFADESWYGRGKIEGGPSQGHEWLKGEGGKLEQPDGPPDDSFFKDYVGDVEFGRWGTILKQGDNKEKPEAGAAWLHTKTNLKKDIPRIHSEDDLKERDSAEQLSETTWIVHNGDDEVYRLEKRPNGQTVVTAIHHQYDQTTSEKVFVHKTSRVIEGDKAGHSWEEREILDTKYQEKHPPLGNFITSQGSIENLQMRGWSRVLTEDPAKQNENPFHMKFSGEWKENESA